MLPLTLVQGSNRRNSMTGNATRPFAGPKMNALPYPKMSDG